MSAFARRRYLPEKTRSPPGALCTIIAPMHWIAPSQEDTDNAALEKRLWDAAEQAVPAPHVAEAEYNGARPEGRLGLIFPRRRE